MNEKVEILTKVYGFVNRIKVCLAFKDIAGIWKVVNELSDYLVSVDCAPTKDAADPCSCGRELHVTRIDVNCSEHGIKPLI